MRPLRERPRVAVLLVAATLAVAITFGIAGAATQGYDSAARQATKRHAAENERALAAARRRIATLELAQQRSEAEAERWQARALRAERKLNRRSSRRRR